MIEEERDPTICYACDAEFLVHTPYDHEDTISFCPFCGSEIEDLDEEAEDDLFDDE
jgi:rRNA maturation endonuclease Nob1